MDLHYTDREFFERKYLMPFNKIHEVVHNKCGVCTLGCMNKTTPEFCAIFKHKCWETLDKENFKLN